MKTLAIIILCGSSALADYIGYHGPNGTQVYPKSHPPLEWDGKTGKNILWQTPLPFFGYGGPIVVKGRVFAVSEPGYKSDFPVLTCLDANTGKVLWEREVNHLSVAVPDELARKKLAQAWHDHVAWRREFKLLHAELAAATDKAAVEAKIAAKGMAMVTDGSKKRVPEAATPSKELVQAGLFWDAWRTGFGGWFPGATFPTPCSDGEFIYVATAWRSYACFDLNGNQKWIQWFPQGGGSTSKNAMRADSGDGCGGSRSPLIWRDHVIMDTFGWVRALDRQTGKVKWAVSRAEVGVGNHEVASPVVFTVGGTDVLWSNGPLAIRLNDGKPLKVEGWTSPGMMVVVNTDERDMLFLTGGGEHGGWENKGNTSNPPPAAVKFALDGETLKATVLWAGIDGKGLPSNCATLAYDAGKVFYCNRGGRILDAKTGKVLAGADKKPATPPTGSMYAIAGGRIYGTGTGGEHGCKKNTNDAPAELVMEVYDLNGQKLASNMLYGPALEGEFKTKHTVAGIPNWFSYSMPFTVAGDRLYVRGCWMFYCIGAK